MINDLLGVNETLFNALNHFDDLHGACALMLDQTLALGPAIGVVVMTDIGQQRALSILVENDPQVLANTSRPETRRRLNLMIWHKKSETAKRVRGRIEKILGAATVLGLRSGHNPAAWRGNLEHVLGRHRKGTKRHQPAMPYAAVPSFLSNLNGQDGLAARALELLIHTASRTSEVLNARWSEFDLEQRIWTIPAERMKAGKEHRVPLTPQVVEMLQSLVGHRTFLFPGQSNSKPLSNMAMLMLLRRMEVADVTVHGFRSSFRDWCGERTEVPREIAEMALAHEVGSEVERAYRRGDALDKRRKLMELWSEYLTARGATTD
ncbi:site-specific integrase [Novosphingobium sp. 1949]|uniref:Site-specific integrase n=1 Tax=Novosphingobium organovorum TaxID=2930092 RepID=A0ABT0BBN1_9SPHN|nr:site-specific integrase [Novosphingobium organovorum]MCJ2182465.1 site-specific integrase [Novosphingobium organovorum]